MCKKIIAGVVALTLCFAPVNQFVNTVSADSPVQNAVPYLQPYTDDPAPGAIDIYGTAKYYWTSRCYSSIAIDKANENYREQWFQVKKYVSENNHTKEKWFRFIAGSYDGVYWFKKGNVPPAKYNGLATWSDKRFPYVPEIGDPDELSAYKEYAYYNVWMYDSLYKYIRDERLRVSYDITSSNGRVTHYETCLWSDLSIRWQMNYNNGYRDSEWNPTPILYESSSYFPYMAGY